MDRRHGARSRMGGRRIVLVLLLVLSAAVVLRAPVDLLAALAPAGRAGASPGSDPSADPRAVASVDRDVAGREDGRGGEGSGGPASPAPIPAGPGEGRWGGPVARPTTGLVLEELRGGWRVESGVEEAAALAVLAAHAWAAEHGVERQGPGGDGGAIVTVEAVERPGALHGVVTLLVAGDTRLHRIAVPVRFSPDGPALAGAPWSLPAPSLRAEPLVGVAIGDAELIEAARAALVRIGIDGARLVALEVTDGWPFIARLEDATGGHPWLRWHVDRFVVTGLPLDAVRE
jgi:hypothetical protein